MCVWCQVFVFVCVYVCVYVCQRGACLMSGKDGQSMFNVLSVCVCVRLQTVYEGQEMNHAFGLCHYNNFLFWNEYRNGLIYKLDMNTKTVTLLRNERPPIFESRTNDPQQCQRALCLSW